MCAGASPLVAKIAGPKWGGHQKIVLEHKEMVKQITQLSLHEK